MISPRVLCVMLAAGRQQMVDRAVRSFREQTYQNKMLYVLDNGPEPVLVAPGNGVYVDRVPPGENARSIGDLRNLANALSLTAVLDCEIIAHWDSDDWSHPLRLEEQVEMLTTSGADAVGYREILFWDSMKAQILVDPSRPLPGGGVQGTVLSVGEAWIYSSPNPKYCTGTSLMYFRARWLKKPFGPLNKGEDLIWQTGVKTMAVSAIVWPTAARLIASIHGGNTESAITKGVREWCRAPEWDPYCRSMMAMQQGAAR